MSRASRFVAPAVVSAATLGHVALLYKAALRHTGGVVSYPVDDTFIHLALAKQLATTGVYGLTPHEFTAASSSIAWPFLLALSMKVFGVTPWLPLLLNAALAVGLFAAVDYAIRKIAPDASIVSRVLVGLVVMVLTPVATLVVLGMEHTAHTAATIAFIAVATSWLADDSESAKTELHRVLPACGWAAGMTIWRYEGIFPIAMVFGLALLRRRLRAGALIAASGALPIVLFGIYSLAHKSHFLPTPVLLKGKHIELKDVSAVLDFLGGDVLDRFGAEGFALAVALGVAALAFAIMRRDGVWTAPVLALVVALGTVILHLQLASIGWFFRYEAYFIAMGFTFGGAVLVKALPPRAELWQRCKNHPAPALVAVIGLVLLSSPLWRRALYANANAPMACRNIYEQQMQSARFLAAHFPHQPVAVNDVGAVAWEGNDRVVDLVGLATLSIAEAKSLKLEKPLPLADLVRLTKGVKVAIVYDEWFKDNLPGSWLRVGKWNIDDNKSAAYTAVSIYATDPATYPVVIEALRAFTSSLPNKVRTEGRFTDRPTTPDRLHSADRVAVLASNNDVSGVYLVAADGTLPLYGLGPSAVRGLTTAEAAVDLEKKIANAPTPERGTHIEKVSIVATRPPSIHVAGSVKKSGEVPVNAYSLDAAVAAAGTLATADIATAWVWRERPEGFVKLGRADLEGGRLVDGDIVVVPAQDPKAAP